MGRIRWILVAVALLGARAAWAQDAHAQMAQALEDQAGAHPAAPQLPVQASAKARKALDQTALGKKGTAERKAHAQDAQAEAGHDAGQVGQAASQARAASAAAQSAAGQAAAQAAKERASHATGRPHGGGTSH